MIGVSDSLTVSKGAEMRSRFRSVETKLITTELGFPLSILNGAPLCRDGREADVDDAPLPPVPQGEPAWPVEARTTFPEAKGG